MPGDILDLIDCALEDCSASDDAMRWNPEPARVICDGGRPLRPERWSPWRHGAWGYTVTVIDATGEAVEGATVTFSVSPETRAAVSRMFHFDHPLSRRRYSRCPLCNPRGNPGRLAVDGREYARRRKARKRR